MNDVGSGRVPTGPGSCPSDQAASHPAPAGGDPSRGPAGNPILVRGAGGWHVLGEDGQRFELIPATHGSKPATEAEHMQVVFDRITHRQIMAAARRISARQHRRSPNWAFAMDLFGLGSTYAWALCEQMGIDPDATTLTPWPASATEAQRAETGTGSVHEGAVGNAETPSPTPSASRVGEG